MESTEAQARGPARDVAIPAVGLGALRRELQREAGSVPTLRALHAAGYRAGEALWDSLRRGPGRDLTELDEETFWERIGGALARRGWGRLVHRAPHPGVGLLASPNWAEAEGPPEDGDPPSCAFSAGLLSGLLTGAAGGPVAVLEVRCRARGDGECGFAFGSATTVHDLYGLLLAGRPFESALVSL